MIGKSNNILMAMFYTFVFLLNIATCSNVGYAAKILIPGSLMRGHGHTTLLSALSAELSARGHQITILVPSDDKLKVRQKFKQSQATEILEYFTDPVEESNFLKYHRAGNVPNPSGASVWKILQEVASEQVSYCRQMLSNTSVMQKLKERHFDVIIADMSNGCEVLLPEVLKVPFIALTSNTELAFMNYNLFGFPLEMPYVISPYIEGGSARHLSFWKRLRNIFVRFIFYRISDYSSNFTPLQHEFNISQDKSILELARKAQFWMSQDSYVLEGSHPTMPNYSPVGGLAAARPCQLQSLRCTFCKQVPTFV